MLQVGGRAHNLEQAGAVAKLGYPFAEISLEDPARVREELSRWITLKNEWGISFLAHYPNEGNPADVDGLRTHFIPRMKELLNLSGELGIHKGTLHFWMDQRWAPPSLLAVKTDLLSELVHVATETDITLCIENLTEHHESFETVFEAIPDLRMTLDIGHGELLSSENTSFNFIEHLFTRIAHVHVHDNHGGKGVEDDLHLPLGDGRIDYPRILSLLNRRGYRSTITMEVKSPDMPRTRAAVLKHIC